MQKLPLVLPESTINTMSKNKNKRRKAHEPIYSVTIYYSENHKAAKVFRLFNTMMDHYLDEFDKHTILSSSITDMRTGEIIHQYPAKEED